jgi:hypothetical protein
MKLIFSWPTNIVADTFSYCSYLDLDTSILSHQGIFILMLITPITTTLLLILNNIKLHISHAQD